MTGTFPAVYGGPQVDLTTLTDGFARMGQGGARLFFTSYTKACAYYEIGTYKIGAPAMFIYLYSPISGQNLTTGTYDPSKYYAGTAETTAPDGGNCAGTFGADGAPTTGTGVTITAIDSTRIAGSFDFTPTSGTQLTGTFDLPICTQQASLNPLECCVP
jgi:hypothetical protein